MFTSIPAKDRAWHVQRNFWANERKQVHYLADQVNLAVYHKRPRREIEALLDALRVATTAARKIH